LRRGAASETRQCRCDGCGRKSEFELKGHVVSSVGLFAMASC
jgi:hypothetical protein